MFFMLKDKLNVAKHQIEYSFKHHIKPGAKKTLHFVKKNPKKVAIIIGALFFVFCGLIALWISTFQMPDLQSFNTRIVNQSTKIYDRTGKVLLYDIQIGRASCRERV